MKSFRFNKLESLTEVREGHPEEKDILSLSYTIYVPGFLRRLFNARQFVQSGDRNLSRLNMAKKRQSLRLTHSIFFQQKVKLIFIIIILLNRLCLLLTDTLAPSHWMWHCSPSRGSQLIQWLLCSVFINLHSQAMKGHLEGKQFLFNPTMEHCTGPRSSRVRALSPKAGRARARVRPPSPGRTKAEPVLGPVLAQVCAWAWG